MIVKSLFLITTIICIGLLFGNIGTASATDYYVSVSGSNFDTGTSVSHAWETPSHAAQQAQAGDTIYLLDGTWYDEHVVFTNSGTESDPIIMTAYDGTPTLDGVDGNGTGIEIRNKAYISIVGVTIDKYNNGINLASSDNILLKDVITRFCEWDGIIVGITSHDCIVENCTVYNNGMHNIAIGRDAYNNVIKDCYSYCDPGLLPTSDYGIVIISGHHNLITNCKVGDLSISKPKSHGGHGVAFVKSNSVEYGSCDNIVENTVVYNWPTGMEARDNSYYNIIRNCTVINDDPENLYDGSYIGFYIFNNADNSTIENCKARGFHEACFGIKSNTNNTLMKNCIAENFNIYGIQMAGTNVTARNCIATNWTGDGEGRAFILNDDSIIKNSIATNSKYGYYYSGSGFPTIVYSDVWNNINNYGGTSSAGTGCISEDPLFVDHTNGNYHLKSASGRWNGSTWVTDSVTSPCIDAGDPTSDYSNELDHPDGHINMGAYGNTEEASLGSIVHMGNISGTVTDANTDRAVEGVIVSDGTRLDTTNSSGVYKINNVSVGTYTVTCTKAGYEDASENNVAVSNSATTIIDFKLAQKEPDTNPPVVTLKTITINGSVDDNTVKEVKINGTTVSVTEGEYSHEVDVTSTNTMTIVATNGDNRTTTRTISVK